MALFLKILGGLAAVALGLWLGKPGRYTPDVERIEEVMERGGGHRHRVKRHFTPLAWIQRQVSSGSRRRSRTGRFRLEAPKDEPRDRH